MGYNYSSNEWHGRRQAINLTNIGLFLIGAFGNISKWNLDQITTFSKSGNQLENVVWKLG